MRWSGRPFAVVASAGTVSTGAVDPLEELADLCQRERLWFHVDAAYGGPAMLADDLPALPDRLLHQAHLLARRCSKVLLPRTSATSSVNTLIALFARRGN